MIQILDILGKKYDDIKSLVIRTDFDEETLKSFSEAGIKPPIREGKFNDDLYFFDLKINKYKVDFNENTVSDLVFLTNKNEALQIINNLKGLEGFKMKFISKKQVEETALEEINDDKSEKHNGMEFKRQRFEFNENSEFDIENIDKYSFITFHSFDTNIIVREEISTGDQGFIFELSPNFNKHDNRKIW